MSHITGKLPIVFLSLSLLGAAAPAGSLPLDASVRLTAKGGKVYVHLRLVNQGEKPVLVESSPSLSLDVDDGGNFLGTGEGAGHSVTGSLFRMLQPRVHLPRSPDLITDDSVADYTLPIEDSAEFLRFLKEASPDARTELSASLFVVYNDPTSGKMTTKEAAFETTIPLLKTMGISHPLTLTSLVGPEPEEEDTDGRGFQPAHRGGGEGQCEGRSKGDNHNRCCRCGWVRRCQPTWRRWVRP